MSVIIKGSAVSITSNSSIDLAVTAGNTCIEKAKIKKSDIDLLINIGIYRDDNIMEPAIAPLIQQKMKLNQDPVQDLMNKRPFRSTYCLDLANSGCGFLYAAQVADSLLKTGTVKNVLIVSSDVHPSQKVNPEFPYTHAGAAVILTQSDDEKRGFGNFLFRTSYTDTASAGVLGFVTIAKLWPEGKGIYEFDAKPDYPDKYLAYAGKTAKEYIESNNISPSSINHVVANECMKGFGKSIIEQLGLNGYAAVPDIFVKYRNAGTSSLIMGYDILDEEKKLKKNDTVLFIGTGSGPTAACALYTV